MVRVTLEAVDKNPVGLGVVVAHLEQPDLGRSQASMVRQPEDGAIADQINHGEQPLDLLLAQEGHRLSLALRLRLDGLGRVGWRFRRWCWGNYGRLRGPYAFKG